jgi:hypothetical protein
VKADKKFIQNPSSVKVDTIEYGNYQEYPGNKMKNVHI